ncbi:MAG TPA: SpoIIE family protein phosphatase, partial [Bacteroidota bacterium]|nr:SpoIIE family protein phosphatase [Bacteroidota bacterium]
MKRGVGYKERSFAFRRDDSFLLYTDGIVEVMNRKGEEFGYERLLRSWSADRSSREACDQIIAQAREFAGSGEFKDDVTLVSVNLSGS